MTSTGYRRARTPEERARAAQARDAKLAGLHEQLTEQVQALASGEQWRRWLDIAARFHTYSFANTVLLLRQRPDVTRVAGYNTWHELGRHVDKGEKGLVIFAPVTRRTQPAEVDETTDKASASDGKPVAIEAADSGPRRVVAWTTSHVWDISQTSGDPLPEPPTPVLLAGEAPDGLLQRLADQVHAACFAMSRVAPDDPRLAGANGITMWQSRQVLVRNDVDPAQRCKTLIHELGHVLMHQPSAESTRECRGVREVEAESVAYLVAAHHGLDTSDYSFAYLASWAHSTAAEDRPIEAILAETGARVLRTARQVIERSESVTALDTDQVGRRDEFAVRVAASAERTARLVHDVNDDEDVSPEPAESARRTTPFRVTVADPNSAIDTWRPVVNAFDPALTRDPHWPALAARLDRIAATGADVAALVAQVTAERALPADHPARSLDYRLSAAAPSAVRPVRPAEPAPPSATPEHRAIDMVSRPRPPARPAPRR